MTRIISVISAFLFISLFANSAERFIYSQNGYMLDTRTGKVWRLETRRGKKKFIPVKYRLAGGKLSLLPAGAQSVSESDTAAVNKASTAPGFKEAPSVSPLVNDLDIAVRMTGGHIDEVMAILSVPTRKIEEYKRAIGVFSLEGDYSEQLRRVAEAMPHKINGINYRDQLEGYRTELLEVYSELRYDITKILSSSGDEYTVERIRNVNDELSLLKDELVAVLSLLRKVSRNVSP